MIELIIFSIFAGVLVKGWLGKLVIFPCLIALSATVRFYYTPKAKLIRENKKIEGGESNALGYVYIFLNKAFISAVFSGGVGLLMNIFV